ncbi:MAG: large-conductance mechanosensitive channel [Armatimonadota bacterium]|nr:MAG: large-conductance mechanosensitive channel [Armatimonadota bacterium]
MLKEFRDFIARGNVVDLAVGIVIGAAFGKIVNSFVEDVLMPPIGLVLGKVDFANLFIDLSGKGYESLAAARTAGAPTLNYGLFLNSIISFVIIAWAVFLVVKATNKIRKAGAEEATQKDCPFCCSSIPLAARRCPYCTSELPQPVS